MASFKFNTEIFYVRTDINEFLREHTFVSDLYDVTLQYLYELQDTAAALDIFNDAYYVCTLAVEQGIRAEEIEQMFGRYMLGFAKEGPTGFYYCIVALLAKSLLRVHQELVDFDPHIIQWLDKFSKDRINPVQYSKVVKNHLGEFDTPLDFSGKLVAMSVKENKCKDERIAELEKLLNLERDKNFTLSMRLSSMVYYKEYSESDTPAIDSEDEIYNAINYQTIKNFACGRSESQASVISNMLGRLALRGRLSGESNAKIDAAIEEIENAHKPQEHREIHCKTYIEKEITNDNKDSQVFNGDIDNSQFGK